MADLSNLVNFSVLLDKSGDTPVIVLTDTTTYPGGVAATVTGVFAVSQPDGIALTGSFTPLADVRWNGSALTTATKELRLAADNNFQNGNYPITYTVKATGYDDTVKTKIFNLQYTPVGLYIADLSDVFTPQLQVQDATRYGVALFNAPTVVRAWSSNIKYVSTAIQTVTASTILFDLAYSGTYYDAHYDISFVATATYTSNTYDWLTVKDKLSQSLQLDAYTPMTLPQLRLGLLTMKTQIEAGTYCGGCGCKNEYAPFTEAQSIFDTFLQNGQAGENLYDLYELQLQLQKYFTCSGIVPQVHTNAGIPDYDWGVPVPSSVNRRPIQFIVGSGAAYAPANGDGDYLNTTLAGYAGYLVYSSADGNYLISGQDFVYNTNGGFSFLGGRTFYTGDKYTIIFN